MKHVTIMLTTDPVTSSCFERSLILMRAEAEATKVRLSWATYRYQRELRKLEKAMHKRASSKG